MSLVVPPKRLKTVQAVQLLIQINVPSSFRLAFLMSSNTADDLESVLWHELGHCAGLVHVPQTGEIMYAYTNAFSTYSSDALSRFFTAITSSAGL